ncbi:TPA: head-tail connector protein [Vibrio parahaemolyticus]
MNYSILSKDYSVSEDLVPLDEIKDHVRVYDPHEESLLEIYRDAAIDFAERYMNKALLPQEVSLHLPSWKYSFHPPLTNKPEVLSLTSGVSEDYKVHDTHQIQSIGNLLHLSPSLHGLSNFTITYKVHESQLPPAVKLGILKLIATWYESREDVSFGVSVSQIPFNHLACFDLYRIPSGA